MSARLPGSLQPLDATYDVKGCTTPRTVARPLLEQWLDEDPQEGDEGHE